MERPLHGESGCKQQASGLLEEGTDYVQVSIDRLIGYADRCAERERLLLMNFKHETGLAKRVPPGFCIETFRWHLDDGRDLGELRSRPQGSTPDNNASKSQQNILAAWERAVERVH